MQAFIKTIRGLAEIEQRAMQLNARQRQLLFLIDTPAFSQLPQPQQQRIATRELLQDLLNLKLITYKSEQSEQAHRLFKKQIQQQVNATPSVAPKTGVTRSLDPSLAREVRPQPTLPVVEFKVLPFQAIQALMMQTLQQHCGLLAKPLMTQIAAAQSLPQLKSCQMQWITYLQESRMPALLLSQTLQQINFAMKALS